MIHGYETEELVQAQIRALLHELAAYERAGAGDSPEAEAVKASLRTFGYQTAAPKERAERRPARSRDRETRTPAVAPPPAKPDPDDEPAAA